MLWLKLGWRNLWRNKGRTLLQLFAISGSLFLGIFLQNLTVGSYAKMIDDGVRMGTGHVTMYHPNYLEERKTELTIPAAKHLVWLRKNPRVLGAFARMQIPGLARSSYENRSAMILGIDVEREQAFNPLLAAKHIASGALPLGKLQRCALVGYKLAKSLRLKVGSKLVVMFQDAHGEIASKLFRISGLLKTGLSQLDAGMIIVNRQQLEKTFGRQDAVHEIAILLNNRTDIKALIQEVNAAGFISEKVGIYPWEVAMSQLADAMRIDHAQLKLMVIILFVLVGIGTVNTLLMSVMERIREFGLLKAMGLDARKIKLIILSEAFVLGIVGTIGGILLSLIGCGYTAVYGLDFTGSFGKVEAAGVIFDPIIFSQWDVKAMGLLSFAMIILVALASLYPAKHALKVKPAEAMRK